jgi:hypothetical protein
LSRACATASRDRGSTPTGRSTPSRCSRCLSRCTP